MWFLLKAQYMNIRLFPNVFKSEYGKWNFMHGSRNILRRKIFFDRRWGGGGVPRPIHSHFLIHVFHVFKVRTQTPFLPDPYIHFTCILHFIWDPLDCCSQLLAPFTVCLHGYKAAYINQQLEKLHLYIFELYHWRQRHK